MKKKNLFEKNQPLREKTTAMKKKKHVITKNKTPLTLKQTQPFWEKKPNPYSLQEKSFGKKKNIGKKQKKENHSLKNTSLLKTFF